MKNTKFERVRGLNDVLPDICSTDQQIESVLQKNFAVFGYRPIDVPLLEQTELYLKKAGEDIVDRLYDFTYRNRRLCLRPEMTASVVRSYVDNLQSAPLPLRLYYHGAAFRYERPQKGRFRQFTQMGIELIGATDIMADAEVIAIACQGLDKLGLNNYRVVIAHIGVLNKFLDQLQIESRLRSFLLANMEILQKQGRQEVEKRLHKLYPSFAIKNDHEETTQTNSKLVKMLQGMSDHDAKTAILDLLSSMNIQLSSTREPAEIVERLLHKIHREDETKIIAQVLDFMQDLGKIAGEPATAMTEAKQLLSRYQIEDSALDQLQEIINTLQNYHLDHSKITVNFGMSRGLQY
jgi:histidyl-tRNA synthetase